MSPSERRARVGEVRPSQLLFSFGVGAILDLPHVSVLVMGLDDWDVASQRPISDARLLSAVRDHLGDQVRHLYSPPRPPSDTEPFEEGALVGVPVASFPRWLVCPFCRLLARIDSGLFELKVQPYRPHQTRYVHANCTKRGKPLPALPARFLVACDHGHLDDFPWHEYVHKGPSQCAGLLRLYDSGRSGEAVDVVVKCEACPASRAMAEAFGDRAEERLPPCSGRSPHLRQAGEGCDRRNRGLLLGASNSWFGVTLPALSIPASRDPLEQLVEENWAFLESVRDAATLVPLRLAGVLRAFARFQDAEVFRAIQAKRDRGSADEDEKDLKREEWRSLTRPEETAQSIDFRLQEVDCPIGYRDAIERVVLVEKLRVVHALLGFTRLESPYDIEEEGTGAKRAPLTRQSPTWVPATEIRGEGIFIQFREEPLADWACGSDEVRAQEDRFLAAHAGWRAVRGLPDPEARFPGVRYVFLHSFGHALMRQLSLECGYSAASLRERIYSRSPQDGDPMAGVLVYTAAPDSEGTLGGLVAMGAPDSLARHIHQALEQIRLCASDPLCAEHDPDGAAGRLHAAACHACLFAPETSCEAGNRYLDRSLLVPTVARQNLAYLKQDESRK